MAIDAEMEERTMGRVQAVRKARPEDCEAIARIYNDAIAERRSTFETGERSVADIQKWLGSGGYPVLVAIDDSAVAGWARISAYSERACYAGIGEASVYVRAPQRGRGIGGALASALMREAARAGYHKLVGKLFLDNCASRRLVARHGFREVGVHRRHGRIDGEWRDVLLVELLLGGATGAAQPAGRSARGSTASGTR
jgi:L-amino acid N-acyltransferase YncA